MAPRPIGPSNPNNSIPWSNLHPRLTEPMKCWENWCILFITQLRREKVSSKFDLPVDPNAPGNRGYMKLINTPMDLQTIQLKVTYRQYVSLAEIKDDFDLISSNSLIFYKKHSAKYNLGVDFAELVNEEWAKCPYQDSSNGPVQKPRASRSATVDTNTKDKRSSSSRSGSRKREKSLPRISQGIRLNAFPDPPNQRYVSMYEFKVGGRAGKRRLTEEIDQLSEEHFIPVLRIIQIRQHERRRNCPSISQMCDLALDLEYIDDDIVLELMDYVKMVKINGPRLNHYLKEMEIRRYEMGLEQFYDSNEEVREKRNMHRENNIITTVNQSERRANGASERVVRKPISKPNSLSNMANLRFSSKNESEEHCLPKKRGWGQRVDISTSNETSHRSIKSSRTSMVKSEQNTKPFEQRKSGGAANVEANDVETKRIKLDRSRSRTDPRTENSRSSDRVATKAEPNKKPGYGQQAYSSIFNKFFGPDDDDDDSRRPVEKKRSDHGVRLAESRTIRSSCAPEKKRSSERAKSLAEPRVARSSRAPEDEKMKKSAQPMASRSFSSPRHGKKPSVEPVTTRSTRDSDNQKKWSSDRLESHHPVPMEIGVELVEPRTTRSSRAAENEKKRSSERAKSLAEPMVAGSSRAPEDEKMKKSAQPMASRSFSSPRHEKKPSVEPVTTRLTRHSEHQKKRSTDRLESHHPVPMEIGVELAESRTSRSSRVLENQTKRSSVRVESAAEPNKKPGYGQQAYSSIFNKFFGPDDDDDDDSRRPVEKKRSDHGVRLAESRTIRSSCDPEKKRSSERAKSLAEPRVPCSSRAPEDEKKRSTASMAARSLSSPRNQKKPSVEPITTRSSRAAENEKKRSSDRVESLTERRVTRSSRAPEDEKKKSAKPMASRSFSSPRHEKKPSVEPMTTRSTRDSDNQKKWSSDRLESHHPVPMEIGVELVEPRTTRSPRAAENEKKRLANRAKSAAQPKTLLKQQEEQNQKEKMDRLNERITRLRSARAAQAGKNVKEEKHVVVDPKKAKQCLKESDGNDSQDRKSRSSALYEEIHVTTAQAKTEQVRRSIRIADEKEREKHDKVSSFHKCIEFDSLEMAEMLDTSSRKAEKSQKQNSRQDVISPPEDDVFSAAEDEPVRFAPAPTASVMKQKIRVNYKKLRPRQIGPVTGWEKWCYDLILDLRDDIRTSFYYKLDDIKRIFGPSRDFIKSPIDFKTIDKKLEYRLYLSLDEVKRDFELIRINNFGSGKLAENTAGYAYEETLFWLWSKCPFPEDIRGIPNPEVVDNSDMNPLLVNELVEDVPTARPKFTFTEEAMWKRTGPLVLQNVSGVPKKPDATRFDDQVVLAPQQEDLDTEAALWEKTGPLVLRNVSGVSAPKETDATRFDDQIVSAPQQEDLDAETASWTGPLALQHASDKSGTSEMYPTRWDPVAKKSEPWCQGKTDLTTSELDPDENTVWIDDDDLLVPQQEVLHTEAASCEETGSLVLQKVSGVSAPMETDTTRYDDQVVLAPQQKVLDTEAASWTGPLAHTHASDISETLEMYPTRWDPVAKKSEPWCQGETDLTTSALDPDENTVLIDGDDFLVPQQEDLDTEVAPWAKTGPLAPPNNNDLSKSMEVEPTRLDDQIVLTPQQEAMAAGVASWSQMGHLFRPSDVSDTVGDETTWLQYDTKYSADRAKILAERVIRSSKRQEELKHTKDIDRLGKALNRLRSERAAKAAKTADEAEHVVDEPEKASQCLRDKRGKSRECQKPNSRRVVISSSEDEGVDDNTMVSAAGDESVESAATRLDDNVVADHDSDLKRLLVDEQVEKTVLTPQQVLLEADLYCCAQKGPIIVPDINDVSESIEVETTKLDDVIVPMFEPVATQTTCDLEIEETRLLDRLDSSPKTDVPHRKVLVDMETQTSEDLVVDRAVRRTKPAVPRPHICRCTCKRSASEMSLSKDIEAPPRKNLKHYFPVVYGGKKMELAVVAVVAPPRKTLKHYFSIVSK